jgi:integrase
VELFLAEKRKSRRQSTVDSHKDRLGRHFPFKAQLADITHQDIVRRLSKVSSNSEHDHALSVAKTFFTWCHNRRYIDDNPTRGLSPHGSHSRARVLSDAELKSIWVTSEKLGTFGIIVRLLILTGQRREKSPRYGLNIAT